MVIETFRKRESYKSRYFLFFYFKLFTFIRKQFQRFGLIFYMNERAKFRIWDNFYENLVTIFILDHKIFFCDLMICRLDDFDEVVAAYHFRGIVINTFNFYCDVELYIGSQQIPILCFN